MTPLRRAFTLTQLARGRFQSSPERKHANAVGDNRRIISGLIINSVPVLVPTPAALPAGLALLGLVAMRKRADPISAIA